VIQPLDTLFLLLAFVAAFAALAARDLLAAVIGFGAFSFLSAMFFASLGALDVAFTEAAVGVVATVLFASVLLRTRERPSLAKERSGKVRALGTALALALAGGGLLHASLSLPAVGDPAAPAAVHVSPRYIEAGPAETGAQNLVTGVLADYRSYDTLGETLVIFTAGLVCLLVGGAAEARALGREP
jgi:multicomponent Na+:H+ antiporter subunit B